MDHVQNFTGIEDVSLKDYNVGEVIKSFLDNGEKDSPIWSGFDDDLLKEEFNEFRNREPDWQMMDNVFHTKPIYSWYCSDTWVGLMAMYVNDELVAVTAQKGRKCYTVIHWINADKRTTTKEAFETCLMTDAPNYSILDNSATVDSLFIG